MAFYGTPIAGMETQYVNGSTYNAMRPAPDDEIPQRFAPRKRSGRRGSGASGSASGTGARSSRPRSQSIASCSRSTRTRSPTDALVDYLTRCARSPLADDLPAHAVHGVGDAAGRRSAATTVRGPRSRRRFRWRCRRGPVSAGASASSNNWLTTITHDTAATLAPRLRRRPGQDPRRVPRVRRRRRCRDDRVSRPRRLPAARRLRHLRAILRGARRAAALDPIVGQRRGERHGRRRRPPRRIRSQVPEGTTRSSTSCSARRASCTACATNVASSATSGPRALCAAPCSPPVAGSRTRAASTTPSTSSTPASTRCACWSPARAGRRPTARATLLGAQLSRTAKEAPVSLGPPSPPPPDPAGLPPGSRGSCTRSASRWASCSAARRRRTKRTCCTVSPPAAAPAKDRPAHLGPSEFDRITQGDVLVTESTTEAFNILLPLLGAIVTDSGGLLSHSAIVARGTAFPAWSGPVTRPTAFPTAPRVHVNGDAGEVTVYT